MLSAVPGPVREQPHVVLGPKKDCDGDGPPRDAGRPRSRPPACALYMSPLRSTGFHSQSIVADLDRAKVVPRGRYRLNQYRARAPGWRVTGAHRRRSARAGEPVESARAPVGCHATGPGWAPAPILIRPIGSTS